MTTLSGPALAAGRAALTQVTDTRCVQCGRVYAAYRFAGPVLDADPCWVTDGRCFTKAEVRRAEHAALAFLEAVLPSLEATIRSQERSHYGIAVNT